MIRLYLFAALAILTSAASARSAGPAQKFSLSPDRSVPLVYHTGFEDSGDLARWEPTDASAWKFSQSDGNGFYSLVKKQSDFHPAVRSPFNRSLLKGVALSDCVLDVKLQSTIPDYNHRDLCLFFGYQDDSHLYYVHLGKRADDHANQIFIVNAAPRKKISLKSTEGTNWTDDWHHARVIRNAQSGEILVFFDDMKTPVMRAVDKTFTWGRVGVGSFDDIGNFDDVTVYGTVVQPPTK